MVCHPHSSLHSALTSPPAPLPWSLAPNEPPGTRSGKHKRDRQGPAPGSAGDKLTVHPASGPQESPYVLINSSVPVPRREPLPPLSSWTTSVGSRNGMADLACSGVHKRPVTEPVVCHLRPLPLDPDLRRASPGAGAGMSVEQVRRREPWSHRGSWRRRGAPCTGPCTWGTLEACAPHPPPSMTMVGFPGEARCPHSAPSVELTCFPASSYHPFPQRVRAPSPGSPGTQLCLWSTRLPSREAGSGSLPGRGPGSPRGAPLWVPARFFTRTLPDRTGLLQVQPVISHKHVGQV